jgi:hypothetical protein
MRYGIYIRENTYRIYLLISREILVKFRTLFYEIDLYAGRKIYSPNTHFLKHLCKKLSEE